MGDMNKIEDTALTQLFKNHFQGVRRFFRIPGDNFEPLQHEKKEVKIIREAVDTLYKVDNKELVHFEFQTTETDIHRFFQYDTNLVMEHKMPVKTYVLYSNGISKSHRSIDYGSIKYHVYPLNMIDINGYEIIKELKSKIQKCEELDVEDIVKLELLPLMGKAKDKKIFIQTAYDMSLYIEDEEARIQVQSVVFGLAEKFKIIIEEELEVIFEMSEIIRRREEKAELRGIEKGIQKGKVELLQQMKPDITMAEISDMLHIPIENVQKIIEEINLTH